MPEPSGGVSSFSPGELAEVLDLRRGVVVRTVAVASVVAVALTFLAPGLLPPNPLVGALTGLVVGLLAVGVAWAVDAGDEFVRGARHIRAVDGTVADRLPADATEERLAGLARSLAARDAAGPLRIAVTRAGGSGSSRQLTRRLARALARLPRRVMYLETTATAAADESIADVVAGDVSPREVVSFDDELMLATLQGDSDRLRTLQSLPELIQQLPSDIEVALIELPPLMEPGALDALSICDHAVVLVADGGTRRVDLLAALDAVDTTHTSAEAVLVTPSTGPAAPAPEPSGPAPEDRLPGWSEETTDQRDTREWTGRVTPAAQRPGPEPGVPRGRMEPDEPTGEPATAAPPGESGESGESVASADPAQPSEPPQPSGPTEPSGPFEPSEPSAPTERERPHVAEPPTTGAPTPAGSGAAEDAGDLPGEPTTGPDRAAEEPTDSAEPAPTTGAAEPDEPLIPDDGVDAAAGDPDVGSELRRIIEPEEEGDDAELSELAGDDDPPAPWERSGPATPSEPPEPASEPPTDGTAPPATPSGPPTEPRADEVPPAETRADEHAGEGPTGTDRDADREPPTPTDADPTERLPADDAPTERLRAEDAPTSGPVTDDPAAGAADGPGPVGSVRVLGSDEAGRGDATDEHDDTTGDPETPPETERQATLRRTAALDALAQRRDGEQADEDDEQDEEDDRDQRES